MAKKDRRRINSGRYLNAPAPTAARLGLSLRDEHKPWNLGMYAQVQESGKLIIPRVLAALGEQEITVRPLKSLLAVVVSHRATAVIQDTARSKGHIVSQTIKSKLERAKDTYDDPHGTCVLARPHIIEHPSDPDNTDSYLAYELIRPPGHGRPGQLAARFLIGGKLVNFFETRNLDPSVVTNNISLDPAVGLMLPVGIVERTEDTRRITNESAILAGKVLLGTPPLLHLGQLEIHESPWPAFAPVQG